ncbi:MAG: MAPEG family protein [Nevskia sp.]|jgi:hypothetical protein|nr:MAPEG family protein [Nevskia sp.]MCK9386286.1 MAPEG family protein [Nevskia sp.]
MIVTPLYAGLLALWFLVLSVRVARNRGKRQVSLGDGGDTMLQRMIRAQGNFAEYVPMVLVLLVILELSHFSTYVLHGLGIALVLGRLLHGYALGFSKQFMFGRVFGTVLTFATLLIAGLLCIYQGVLGLQLQ